MNKRLGLAIIDYPNETEVISNQFGKCSRFIVCEFDKNNDLVKKESYFNPLNEYQFGQKQLPGYIKQFDVTVIISGEMGEEAIANFQNLGIEVVSAPGLSTKEAIKLYFLGKLKNYPVKPD